MTLAYMEPMVRKMQISLTQRTFSYTFFTFNNISCRLSLSFYSLSSTIPSARWIEDEKWHSSMHRMLSSFRRVDDGFSTSATQQQLEGHWRE